MTGKIIRGIGMTVHEMGGDADSLDHALETVESLGCGYAELSFYAEDLVAGGRVLWRRVEDYRARCAKHGLRYTVHGPLCGNFMDEANRVMHMAVARAMIEITAAVGADVLVCHAGRVPACDEATGERLLGLEREALRTLGEAARTLGVTLALENLFSEGELVAGSVVRVARQVAAIAHENVVGALDFSHARIQTTIEGIDYAQSLAAFAPYVRHLHVHDSFGRPKGVRTFHRSEDLAYGQGDLHVPLGWGDIPWDEIVPGLRVRPGTTLIVELPQRHWAEARETLARAREIAGMLEAASFTVRRPAVG